MKKRVTRTRTTRRVVSRGPARRRANPQYNLKLHNPDFDRFVIIEGDDPYMDDLVYPVDTHEQMQLAINEMISRGIARLPVLAGDPDGDTVRTSMILFAI